MSTFYSGDLGPTYTPGGTTLTLYAPDAREVTLLLVEGEHPMRRHDNGTWRVTLDGDRHGTHYRYLLTRADGTTVESTDPWAHGVAANGVASVIIDFSRTGGPVPRMPSFGATTDAVIYEAHVRDMTIGRDSGVVKPGTFVGLAQPRTRTPEGAPTGLDYLSGLGVTHVQFLPIYDFGSVDELGNLRMGHQYNWGYDPDHHNAVEGSYATDPADPLSRIRELKQMVTTLHDRGLRVIMDVVYNHVYDVTTSPLALTAPDAYFRRTPDGRFLDATYCGSETASEHPMMRRYIVDSVAWWAEEFGLDGFRFDLMGVHDTGTMAAVRARLDDIDPSIIVIGEGWEMGNHPHGVTPANFHNADNLPGVGFFNDVFRDTVRGPVFQPTHPGAISGAASTEISRRLFDVLTGSRGERRFLSAAQSVNFIEVHDNHTLRDALKFAMPHADESEIARRHMLGTELVMLAAGVPFLHAGQEMMRSKEGDGNSYRSSDHVNAFDYPRGQREPYATVGRHVRELIAWRRRSDWLRVHTLDEITATRHLEVAEPGRLQYRVTGRTEHRVFVNTSDHAWHAEAGEHVVELADHRVQHTPGHGTTVVAPWSVTVVTYP